MKPSYDPETNTVTVTVRELVDFVCRSGDIGRRQAVTAEEGALAHKRAEDGSDGAILEVPLEAEVTRGGITYRLVGRADMITPGGDIDRIEELKTTSGTFFGGTPNIPDAHIAQCVLYAFMWCRGTGSKNAAVRITYIPKGDGKTRSFESVFSADELAAEAGALIARYAMWAELAIGRAASLPASVKAIRFPYGDVREGQLEFMTAAMRAIRRRGRALLQAPTGTGKTMAAMYPAVKSLGAGIADRIFYLTPKTSTRLSAEAAANELLRACEPLRAISLLAKERVCPNAELLRSGQPCSAETCDRAKGHYDRVNDALWELISHAGTRRVITTADIAACAERFRVCPYELSLDAADFCDIIICDYNYVFDPRVYLRRFFDGGAEGAHAGERFVLLCDEAHDLVDRAREMFSAELRLSDVETPLTALKSSAQDGGGGCDGGDAVFPELIAALTDTSDRIRANRALCEDITLDGSNRERGYYVGGEPFAELAKSAAAAAEECGRASFYLRTSTEPGMRRLAAELSALRRSLSDFAESSENFDRRRVAYFELSGGDMKCSHICLDASDMLDARMRGCAAVLFSATLEPPDYFARVLGCRDADTVELPSPYDEKNLCLLCADKISTRMQDRAVSAVDIAAMVYAVAMSHTGNYICYLPSYAYLKTVADEFSGRYSADVDVVIQKQRMTEREREAFLSEFTPAPSRPKVGFCVLGGVFAEGVDLPGDRLSGAVIVGVGLPGLSAETNLLRDYYERICERGYEFAYVFPGMNKVLQAAGRVIRSERDRGVVLLIDDRFGSREYTTLFPSHWRNMKYVGDLRSLGMALMEFWRG